MVDHRVEDVIKLINLLFYIERVLQGEDDTSPEARLAFRKRWSKRIVDRIMNRLEKIRKAGSEYGTMVHRAVNYILDDREAFERFNESFIPCNYVARPLEEEAVA